MSGDATGEMVYLESRVNNQKKVFMGGGVNSVYAQAKESLPVLMRASILMQYMEDASVKKIFKDVSTRVVTFYAKLDKAIIAANDIYKKQSPVLWVADNGINFEAAYRAWQKEFLSEQQERWKKWKNSQLAAAVKEVNQAKNGMAVAKALKSQIDDRKTDLLSDATFSPAAGLTI